MTAPRLSKTSESDYNRVRVFMERAILVNVATTRTEKEEAEESMAELAGLAARPTFAGAACSIF